MYNCYGDSDFSCYTTTRPINVQLTEQTYGHETCGRNTLTHCLVQILYIVVYEQIITLEKCHIIASRLITFSVINEEETDETCLMQTCWELDNVLGTRSTQHIKNKTKKNDDDDINY
jgi:hypothetical protein